MQERYVTILQNKLNTIISELQEINNKFEHGIDLHLVTEEIDAVGPFMQEVLRTLPDSDVAVFENAEPDTEKDGPHHQLWALRNKVNEVMAEHRIRHTCQPDQDTKCKVCELEELL